MTSSSQTQASDSLEGDRRQINGSLRPSQLGTPSNSVPASRIEPALVEWLWRGFLPLGKITILDGDPGVGKTLLTIDLAARVSRGLPMPSCGEACAPASVLLMSCEDGIQDTVLPRLVAAAADLERVRLFTALADGRLPALTKDLQIIRREIEVSSARLVVIDPLMAYLPDEVNSWKDQSVRRALAPLAKVADETGCAVLLVRHPTKGEHVKAIHAGGGSIAILGLARVGLLVAPDPDDPDVKVLAVSKCNVMKRAPSLRYRIAIDAVGEAAINAPRIDWVGESALTADDLVATVVPPRQRPRDEAVHFLEELLADGPVAATRVQEEAQRRGIAPATLNRAKKAAGVVSERRSWYEHRGFRMPNDSDGGWFWSARTLVDRHSGGGLGTTPPAAAQSASPIQRFSNE